MSNQFPRIDIQPDGSHPYGDINVNINEGVAYVVLNRPDVINALDAPLIDHLTELFGLLAHDDRVKAVVLAGQGEAFSSGVDLNWLHAITQPDYPNRKKDTRKIVDFFETLYQFPKPLIAQVQHSAYAGGAGIAAACDYVIASEGTSFAFPTIKFNMLPYPIGPCCVERLGRQNATVLFSTGQKFSATDAKRWGLVDEVCPFHLFPDHINTRLEKIRNMGAKGKEYLRTLSGRQRPRIDIEDEAVAIPDKMQELIEISANPPEERATLLDYLADGLAENCADPAVQEKIERHRALVRDHPPRRR